MTAVIEPGLVGDRYRSSRLRVDALLRNTDPSSWEIAVTACPGWRVRDVLAHLVGVVEDAVAGKLQGPPSAEQTADEVARHRDDDVIDLLDQWAATAPPVEQAVSDLGLWPAFYDVLSHEHDLRGALHDRRFRDHDDVRVAAHLLTGELPPGLAVRLDTERGPDVVTATEPPVATLTTTSFEFFRLRFGRRTREQALALPWTGDPDPVIDDLFIFGPADAALDE